MKKLIALAGVFLLSVVSVLTASALPMLAPATLLFNQNYVVMGLTSAIDVSVLTTYAEKNQMGIISSLVNALDIKNDVMVHPGVKNKIPMTKLKIGNGLRPFSSTVEWKTGDAQYSNRFLEVKLAKREMFLNPADYQSTYLAWEMEAGSGSNKRSLPYEQHFWDQVGKGIARELNDETAFHGFDGSATADYNAGTAYSVGNQMKYASTSNNPNAAKDWWECIVATSAGQTPDSHPSKWQNVTARAVAIGLKTRIATGISGSEISPVATGAITSTAGVAITAFKKLYRSFDPAYKNNGIIISASYTDFEFLLDDLSDKYKAVKDNVDAKGYLVLPDTDNKCVIKPASWLGSSRRLIAGPVFMANGNPKHMNLLMATDVENDMTGIETLPKENRSFWAGVNFAIGFNYQDPTAIKVGDQA